MIVLAINILILSVLLLIVGLINPKWLLFWMDKPGRIPIIMLSSVLFMIGATLFGEASRQKQETLATESQQPSDTAPIVEGNNKNQ